LAVAQQLPQGSCQAGDRHLNFHETRDNLHHGPPGSVSAVEGRSYGATEFCGLKITNLLLKRPRSTGSTS
jgi:hypothetical protein